MTYEVPTFGEPATARVVHVPNLRFGAGRSRRKEPIGNFECLKHVNRTMGTAVKAVDAPEALSL